MKNNMVKKTYEEVVKTFAIGYSTSSSAFIFACVGVLTQTFHNYYLSEMLSSYDNVYAKTIIAGIGAFFLSSGLLYFTVKKSNIIEVDDKERFHKIKNLVTIFFFFEVFCNLSYWSNKYIFTPFQINGWVDVEWFKMVIALPFSFMIPYLIKSYASEMSFIDVKVNEVSSNFDTSDIEYRMEKGFEHINKEMEKCVKNGAKMNLNIDTKNDKGENVVKILKATVEKSNIIKQEDNE